MTFQSVFRYFAIFVFALTFGGQKALASDDFCAVGGDKVNIFAKIPVTSAGNLQDYLQTNKQSRIATLEDLLVASESLGAATDSGLKQIQEFLFGLNDFYSYMLKSSSENIGVLISERLTGEIDALYFNNNTNDRRIRFVADITQGKPSAIDYSAYGTYAYVGESSISISLKLIRLSDGETRTFIATGEPLAATKRLALKIFDALQFPGKQGIFNPLSEAEWLGGKQSGVPSFMRLSEAAEYCQAFGARLPTKIELLMAYNIGPYVSGVKIDGSRSFAVTDIGQVKSFIPDSGQCFMPGLDPTKQADVICIKTK